MVICKEEIAKLRKLEESSTGGGSGGAQQRGGINTAVAEDVNTIFKGKTVSVHPQRNDDHWRVMRTDAE